MFSHLSTHRHLIELAAAASLLAADVASSPSRRRDRTHCEAPPSVPGRRSSGGLPARSHHRPTAPYPAWDYDWDGRGTPGSSPETLRTLDGYRGSRRTGTTRHLVLVRHGQYDMSHPEDDARCRLTALGRRQALRTGQRLALLAQQLGDPTEVPTRDGASPTAITIRAIHQSDMTRAKETAEIIASQLPDVVLRDPDPMLNEALPAPMIPVRPDVPNAEQEINENHERIEAAFRKYFCRAVESEGQERGDGAATSGATRHEFEVVVGHANVIRYFVCRALQLPPEAWLRMSIFNCSITYITIQPNGYVTIRLLGDAGHIPYEETTFSGNYGWNWS